MAAAGEVLINILTKGDAKGAEKVTASLERLGQRATAIGKSLSLRLTAPIAAAFGASLVAYGQQEKAEIELAAALRATGQEVDRNIAKLKEQAAAIQAVTTVGDEQSLQLAATATQMGVQADQMDEVLRGAIGLSRAFDMDLKTAVRGAAAAVQGKTELLSRYIPMLSEVEDEGEKVAMVSNAMATGFAQAEAEAQSTAGKIAQLKNSVGDLAEQIGAQLVPILMPAIETIKGMVANFSELDDGTKKVIVTVGLLAAAIGPAAIALGLMLKTTTAVSRALLAMGGSASKAKRALDAMVVSAGGAKAVLGKAGLIGLAAGAGFALGTLIDKTLGVSDAIDEWHEGWINSNKDIIDQLDEQRRLVGEIAFAAETASEVEAAQAELIAQRKQAVIALNQAIHDGEKEIVEEQQKQINHIDGLLSGLEAKKTRIEAGTAATKEQTTATEKTTAAIDDQTDSVRQLGAAIDDTTQAARNDLQTRLAIARELEAGNLAEAEAIEERANLEAEAAALAEKTKQPYEEVLQLLEYISAQEAKRADLAAAAQEAANQTLTGIEGQNNALREQQSLLQKNQSEVDKLAALAESMGEDVSFRGENDQDLYIGGRNYGNRTEGLNMAGEFFRDRSGASAPNEDADPSAPNTDAGQGMDPTVPADPSSPDGVKDASEGAQEEIAEAIAAAIEEIDAVKSAVIEGILEMQTQIVASIDGIGAAFDKFGTANFERHDKLASQIRSTRN